jgi:hypothetical protein
LLGKSIYVPREDLLGDIPNGISFYTKIPDACKRKVNLATTTKDQSFYKNTGEFYKSIATETGLDAKYEGHFSLGASLDVTTKSVSGSKREVSGTSLNLATKAYEEQVKPNCLYNTEKHSRLVKDFSALQKKIATPWHKSSWTDYQRYSFSAFHTFDLFQPRQSLGEGLIVERGFKCPLVTLKIVYGSRSQNIYLSFVFIASE